MARPPGGSEKRRFFRIREAADRLGVSESTIRKYERLGVIPAPSRNPGGHRVYTERHLEVIRRAFAIHHNTREETMKE